MLFFILFPNFFQWKLVKITKIAHDKPQQSEQMQRQNLTSIALSKMDYRLKRGRRNYILADLMLEMTEYRLCHQNMHQQRAFFISE